MSDPRRVAKLRDQPHMPDLSDAACRGRDDLDWVPDGETPLHLVRAALDLCAECPVATPCLDYALTTGQDGIWGGTTTQTRHKTRKDPTR